jgi:uncharacterized phage-like protein YoqJ
MDNLREIDPTRAVSFSGHRPDRLPGNGDPDAPEAKRLAAVLQKEIIAAIDRGMTTFIHGCMAGFDLFAALQVIEIKKQFPGVQLVSVAPYSVHFFSKEKCWTQEWETRAREVFAQHDFGISLAEHYRSGIYYERNRVLVAHSSVLICYHDGGWGGTKYTVDRAIEKGLTVKNLYGKEVK